VQKQERVNNTFNQWETSNAYNKQCETDSDWSASFGQWPVSTLVAILSATVQCGLLKNIKGPLKNQVLSKKLLKVQRLIS
jgi:hypothetical protein